MSIEHTMDAARKCMVGVLIAVLTFFLFAASTAAQNQDQGQNSGLATDGNAAANGSQRFVSIDFNNVDISVFIKFISELTGKNFVIDQRVKGKVTIISPSKISVDEAFKVFESVLDVHGFATVETGKLIKIIPSPDARTKSIETRTRTKGDSDNDQVVTQLVPLRYADPDEVKRLFTPMVSKSSVILSYAPTNTLIITDNYSNIARLMKILKTIDIPGVGREITIFPIHNADASKLVSLLETVFKNSQGPVKKGAPPSDRSAALVADERTNSIIMVASEVDTNRIRSLIDTLDLETPKGKEKIHVYYLEYAVAEEIVAVLKDLPKEDKAAATGGAKEAPVVSDKVTITADKATNSLIITADRDDYATLVEIIRQIDIPRSMVYIEALIMEVNAEKSFDLGTEWVVGDDVDLNNDRQGIVGGGFTTDDTNLQFSPTTGALVPALASGFSLGLFGEAIEIAGVSFPSIAAIVQAYKKDRDINILSTPQLLTTDNQEASITVGKNIPFQTTTSTTNNDTFNSFEYRDVGKTLKITPQINKDRMVRLNLSLEVSALESSVDNRPTTLKRTVETTVMVRDSSTVVIGGLIDDTFSQTEYKVPCLGDIPGLGWLFKTRSKGNEKSNLFIFITPRVIQNPEEASTIYESKKSTINEMREMQIKMYNGDADKIPALSIETNPQNESVPGAVMDGADGTGTGDPVMQINPSAAESVGNRSADGYHLQVQSFSDQLSAIESVERLKQMGHQAYITETDVDGKIWYRVQIGGFPDRVAAQMARDTLSGQGMTDTLIIKNNP